MKFGAFLLDTLIKSSQRASLPDPFKKRHFPNSFKKMVQSLLQVGPNQPGRNESFKQITYDYYQAHFLQALEDKVADLVKQKVSFLVEKRQSVEQKVLENLKKDVSWLNKVAERQNDKIQRDDLVMSVQQVCMERAKELIRNQAEVRSALETFLFFEPTDWFGKISYRSCEKLSSEEPFLQSFEDVRINPLKDAFKTSWMIYLEKKKRLQKGTLS